MLHISQFQLRPDPREFAFFFSWIENSRGRGHLSCQMPGDGNERRGKCPAIHNESKAAGWETRQPRTLKAPDVAILEFEI